MGHRLGLWLLFLSATLVPSATAWAKPVPSDHGCMGRWVGRGQNTGFATYWTIDLTLTASPAGGRCGTIEYTNPACGGTLESCRLVGQDVHTRENYAHREGDCAPAGQVIIRCEGEQMRYSWIGWERVDTVLRRPGSSAQPPSAGGGIPTPTPGPKQTPSATDSPIPAPQQAPPAPEEPPQSALPEAGDASSGCGARCSPSNGAPASGVHTLVALLVLIRLRARRRPR